MSSEGSDLSASGVGAEVDPMIGQTIDKRYKITAKLGEGGMGEVYAADHLRISRRVALKLLRSEVLTNDEAVKRFEQEAMTASSIGHDNIIRIEDSGKLEDGRIYLAMELLDGQPFNDMIDQGLVAPERLLHILIQTGHGLAAAHGKGIIHRDMKPENIYITNKSDGTDLPKLLDFGIAKVSQAEGENHLTRTGTIFGTPFYMAPEQALGETVDHRVDVYAMGVIMYEVFCGVVPFEGESFMGILTQHITAEPLLPSEMAQRHGRHVPPGVEEVILKAMKKNPAERYQTMDDLVQALVPLYRGLAGAGASTYMAAYPAGQSSNSVVAALPVSGQSQPYIPPDQSQPNIPSSQPYNPADQSQPYMPAAQSQGGSMPYAAMYPGASGSMMMPPKKGKGGLIVGLVAVLAIAGGVAYYFATQQDDKPKVAEKDKDKDSKPAVHLDATVAAVDPATNSDAGSVALVVTADAAVTITAPDARAVISDDPPPSTTKTVLLDSNPPKALVYINGKKVGRAPLILQVDPDEPMSVVLKVKRRKDKQLILDGSKEKVTAVLERKGGSRPNSNPDPDPDPGNNPDPDPRPVDPCKKNPNLPECMLE